MHRCKFSQLLAQALNAAIYGDSEITKEILLKLLRDFGELCEKLEVIPIIMHGGLIGWYWCSRLLRWDNDLDICVTCKDPLKLDVATNHEDLYDNRNYL